MVELKRPRLPATRPIPPARRECAASGRYISLQTYLELVQGAKDRRQLFFARRFLAEFSFETLPLTPSVGNRAAQLVESYALSHGMRAGDALVAATALEHNLPLCTANVRHYRQIPSLSIIDIPGNA